MLLANFDRWLEHLSFPFFALCLLLCLSFLLLQSEGHGNFKQQPNMKTCLHGGGGSWYLIWFGVKFRQWLVLEHCQQGVSSFNTWICDISHHFPSQSSRRGGPWYTYIIQIIQIPMISKFFTISWNFHHQDPVRSFFFLVLTLGFPVPGGPRPKLSRSCA